MQIIRLRLCRIEKISLSEIKPTGELRIGNHLAMIKPASDLADDYQALYFIADCHALTTVWDRKKSNQLIYDAAASLRLLSHQRGQYGRQE